jgi:hypothetical protein
MNLSNLDHIQTIAQEAQELSGGSVYNGDYFSLSSYVNVYGNRAISRASANAYGNNTFTAASSDTHTSGYSSSSNASSDSATDDYYWYY